MTVPRKLTFSGVTVGELDVDNAALLSFVGWDGWTNKTDGVSEYAAADGGSAQNLWVGSRRITFQLVCRANDSNTVTAAFTRNQTASVLLVDWISNGVLEKEQATMRVISVVGGRVIADEVAGIRRFMVTMQAADPYVYSQTEQSQVGPVDGGVLAWAMPHLLPGTAIISTGAPATLTVDNVGVPTWPTFQVAGPATGTMTGLTLLLAETGEQLVLPNLAAGQTMLIDSNPTTRLVTVDGFDKLSETGGVFWLLPAGESTVRLAAGGSTVDATVTIFWRTARL